MNQFLILGFNRLSRRKILISLPNQSQIDCNVHGPAKPIKAEPASLISNTNPGLIVIKPSISIREFTGRKKFFMARCRMIEIPIILAKIIKNSDPQNRLHDPASTTARFSSNDRIICPQRPHDSGRVSRRLRALKKTFRAFNENAETNQ